MPKKTDRPFTNRYPVHKFLSKFWFQIFYQLFPVNTLGILWKKKRCFKYEWNDMVIKETLFYIRYNFNFKVITNVNNINRGLCPRLMRSKLYKMSVLFHLTCKLQLYFYKINTEGGQMVWSLRKTNMQYRNLKVPWNIQNIGYNILS